MGGLAGARVGGVRAKDGAFASSSKQLGNGKIFV